MKMSRICFIVILGVTMTGRVVGHPSATNVTQRIDDLAVEYQVLAKVVSFDGESVRLPEGDFKKAGDAMSRFLEKAEHSLKDEADVCDALARFYLAKAYRIAWSVAASSGNSSLASKHRQKVQDLCKPLLEAPAHPGALEIMAQITGNRREALEYRKRAALRGCLTSFLIIRGEMPPGGGTSGFPDNPYFANVEELYVFGFYELLLMAEQRMPINLVADHRPGLYVMIVRHGIYTEEDDGDFLRFREYQQEAIEYWRNRYRTLRQGEIDIAVW